MTNTTRKHQLTQPRTVADLRRYRMYMTRNRAGNWLYTIDEIAQIEGITRFGVYLSLWKFPNFVSRKPGLKIRKKDLT